jgi:uncharacterized protein involved in type VI secretion and phage assembly
MTSEIEETLVEVARDQQRRHYGKHRGVVVDAADPLGRGRLRLRVPSVLGEDVSGWAEACLPYGGRADEGMFLVPSVDARVWVEFEAGNPDRPIWTGVSWQSASDVPAGAGPAQPTVKVLRTTAGHTLLFDDTEGAETIQLAHPADAELVIDPAGEVTVRSPGGAQVLLTSGGDVRITAAGGNEVALTSQRVSIEDAAGNRIELGPGGATVSAAVSVTVEAPQVALGTAGGEPLLKGTTFLSSYLAHVHPTASGPSGPPIPTGETSALSTSVRSS